MSKPSASQRRDDSRDRIDARIDTPGREGLTGTTGASVYDAVHDSEQITLPPDGRPMEAEPAWRNDFPVDAPQDAYVERREFMKFIVLTSLSFTVGQLWIAGQSVWRRTRSRFSPRKVAALSAIPAGGVVTFAYPGPHDDCFLARMPDDSLVAYGQKCTHLSCAVRPLVDQGVIECPCHHGYFDLKTGRPIAGPPRRPLPRVQLDIRSDDIYATGIEERTV